MVITEILRIHAPVHTGCVYERWEELGMKEKFSGRWKETERGMFFELTRISLIGIRKEWIHESKIRFVDKFDNMFMCSTGG